MRLRTQRSSMYKLLCPCTIASAQQKSRHALYRSQAQSTEDMDITKVVAIWDLGSGISLHRQKKRTLSLHRSEMRQLLVRLGLACLSCSLWQGERDR